MLVSFLTVKSYYVCDFQDNSNENTLYKISKKLSLYDSMTWDK